MYSYFILDIWHLKLHAAPLNIWAHRSERSLPLSQTDICFKVPLQGSHCFIRDIKWPRWPEESVKTHPQLKQSNFASPRDFSCSLCNWVSVDLAVEAVALLLEWRRDPAWSGAEGTAKGKKLLGRQALDANSWQEGRRAGCGQMGGKVE